MLLVQTVWSPDSVCIGITWDTCALFHFVFNENHWWWDARFFIFKIPQLLSIHTSIWQQLDLGLSGDLFRATIEGRIQKWDKKNIKFQINTLLPIAVIYWSSTKISLKEFVCGKITHTHTHTVDSWTLQVWTAIYLHGFFSITTYNIINIFSFLWFS